MKLLYGGNSGRHSTIDDVADFVVDYIISDVSSRCTIIFRPFKANTRLTESGNYREEMVGHR